ncbi:MAG: UvrD-helicase domain-containing protein [Cyclobacteriaceae bacterium]
MQKPFVIYRSSAGSGKTYTLAREYLKLALRQPMAYRSILAVTFTNKATQEMKSRILQSLYQVAKAKDSSLRQELAEELDMPEMEVSLQAETVLQYLLHGYSYFSVMTIDAFFQKVVRGFAREMGLQAGFHIELDLNKVLDAVIDQLLLEISDPQHRTLRQWLTRYAEEKVEEGNSWDFRKDIKSLAFELFKESYREKQSSLATQAVTTQSAATLLEKLRKLQQAFEQHMAEIGQAALSLLDQEGVTVADFSYGKNGVVGYFAKITEGDAYVPGTRILQGQENIEGWVSKKHPQRESLLSVATLLHPRLEEALDAYQEYGPLYHSVIQLQRFLYAYGILHHLEDRIQQYKKENDLMLISDAPVFLQDIIGKDDTPFIYEKIGSYYQNFLIDEFQDTSGLQWQNFRPLVENSLDSGHHNLVVGDVKQSIYRWRGGDWKLLLETIQEDVQEWRTQVKNLDRNFRSKRNIIAFNNALFETLPAILHQKMVEDIEGLEDETLRNRLLQQAAIVERAYEDAPQKLPETYDHHAGWHGHIRIQLLDEEYCTDEEGEPTDWRTYVRQELPGMIESLQEEGYAAKDIAFLVRDKRDGRAVVDTFMQYKNEGKAKPQYDYEVVSSESLFLNASLCVNLLVDLMQFLDNPDDLLVRGSIVYKYHKLTRESLPSSELHRIFGGEASDAEESLILFFQQLPTDFQTFYQYLNKLPMYELVENLIQIFDLGTYHEKAYIQAFQDVVLQYAKIEQGDLHTFLGWWTDQGKESSVQLSEEVNAMRVMTIHKAKGLQFKVVIVPFCDWNLDHHPFKTNILWTNPQDSALEGAGLLPMKYSSQLTHTLFSQEYYEEKIRIHIDHLNLLYVAFTRAEEGLYAFARPTSTRQGNFPLKGIANLLRTALPDLEPEEGGALSGWDEMAQIYEVGERLVKNTEQKEEADNDRPEVAQLTTYPSVRWRNRLSIRPFSRGLFQSKVGLWTVSQAALMQLLLIQVRTPQELAWRIEKLSFERGLTERERLILQKQAEHFLTRPEVVGWYQPQKTLYIQRPLFLEKSRKYLSVDRVLIEDQSVILINFGLPHDREEKKRSLEISQAYLRKQYADVKAHLVEVTDLSITNI